jgi:hypothetical protein
MNIKQTSCTIAAFAAIASSAIAQGNVAVPAHTSIYNGFSRGFSTVAAVDFVIDEIELDLVAQQAGDTASFLVQVNGIDVYTDTGGTNAISTPASPIVCLTGDTVMVIGHWSATPTSNFGAHNSYASGAAPAATTILGVAHTLDRAGYQCDIGDAASYGGGTANGGAGSFTGITGSLGRCYITASAFTGVAASVTETGSGCGGEGLASFYEVSAPGVNDLENQKIVGTKNGAGGYDVTIVPGTGFAVPFGSTNVMLGDDAQTAVGAFGTLGMVVGSNGWLALGAGNSNGFAPSTSAMLNNPSEGVYAWTDLQPDAAGSGAIYYSESGTVAAATYEGVFGWGTSDPNNIKITYDTSNGDWTIEFETTGASNPEEWLIGYSTATDSGDGGSIDISAAAPFSTTAADSFDLAISNVNLPLQLGSGNNPFDVTTSNIPSSAVSHLGIVGLTNPALPLDAVGLPGCFLNAASDVLSFSLTTSPGADVTWTALTLPPGNALAGVQFHVSSAIFGTSANSFLGLGATTANGLECSIGF